MSAEDIMEGSSSGVRETSVGAPSDGKFTKHAYVEFLVVVLAGVACSWAVYKVTPVIPTMITELNVSPTLAGWIMSVANLLGIVLAFPATAILKKLGVKKAGVMTMAIVLVGTIIGYFAADQVMLIISRVIEGFGIGLIGVIAPSVINMWFPIQKRGLPMGLWSVWQGISVAFTFLITIPINNALGSWKGVWLFGMLLLVIAIILYGIIARSPQGDEANYADSEDASVNVFAVLKERSPWIICIGGLTFGLAASVFVTWIASYWMQEGGLSEASANNIVSIVYFLEIVFAILAGWVLNKVHRRRVWIVVVSILYAAVYLAAFIFHTMAGIWIVALTYAVIESCFTAAMWTLVGQTVKDPRLTSGAVAMYTIFVSLGMMLGSPIGGFVIENASWLALSVLVCVFQLISAVAFSRLKLYDEKGNLVKI